MSKENTRPNWRVIVDINGKVLDWKDARPLAQIINAYLEKTGQELPDKEKLV